MVNVENSPEVIISLGQVDGTTLVDIDGLEDHKYITETFEIIEDLATRGLQRWYSEPIDTVDDSEEALRIIFPQTSHLGSFINAYGENGGRILAELLESDGITVDFNEKVKDLTLPIEPSAE